MIFIRAFLSILFLILLCNPVHSQEPPSVSANKIPDSLSLQSKDTDGDGVNDDADKCINEKGPLSNFGCPVIAGIATRCGIAKKHILFAKGSTSLSSVSVRMLNDLAKIMEENPGFYVKLIGYSDNVGNKDSHIKLSLARAEVAMNYLVTTGLNKNRIRCLSVALSKSLVSGGSKARQEKNRWVEFDIVANLND